MTELPEKGNALRNALRDGIDRAATMLLELVQEDKLSLVDYERLIAALYGLDLDQ
jgi:hypothetical protein